MSTIPRARAERPKLATLLLLVACLVLSATAHAGGGHAGLPTPSVELATDAVTVPFVVPPEFPVPVVEVTLDGGGPYRLAVDTAMGGTILLRQEVAASMGLAVIGKALVGDSSGSEPKPADLVRIDEMVVGGLTVRDIVGLGFAAGEAHISDVPEDLDGILGNQIYAELLTTLDYPGRRLTFRRGTLADDPAAISYEDQGRVMTVELGVAGSTIPVVVDSGHRGTITLPRSLAGTLPLSGEPRQLATMSTVSETYERTAIRLDGDAVLAGARLIAPEVVFSDDHTPRLIGYGVLEHFAITIDQSARRLRFTPASETPIEGIVVR